MRHISWKKRIWFAPLIIGGIAFIIFLTQQLWNYLMPLIFHLPVISYWQMLGLMALLRLLFGCGHHWRHHHNHKANILAEKWEKMSPEEREKFRERMHQHRHYCENRREFFDDKKENKE